MTEFHNSLRIHSSMLGFELSEDDYYNEHQIPPNKKILEEYKVREPK